MYARFHRWCRVHHIRDARIRTEQQAESSQQQQQQQQGQHTKQGLVGELSETSTSVSESKEQQPKQQFRPSFRLKAESLTETSSCYSDYNSDDDSTSDDSSSTTTTKEPKLNPDLGLLVTTDNPGSFTEAKREQWGRYVSALRLAATESQDYNALVGDAARNMDQGFHQVSRDGRVLLGKFLSEEKFPETVYKIFVYLADNVKYESGMGFSCSPILRRVLRSLYSVVWNLSDSSRDLSKNFAEIGIVKLMANNLTHEPYIKDQHVSDVLFLLLASLSILHNIARAYDDRTSFVEAKVKEAVQPYLGSKDVEMKAVSVMILSNIISEEENSVLEDTGAIPYMITCLLNATLTSDRQWDGFSPAEIGECLSRLAVNESNKQTIVNKGALPLLVNMMETSDEEEQLAAIRTLWTLAFDDDIRKQIHQQDKCVETLETLAENGKENVKNAAKGALWVIHENLKRAATPASELTDGKQHVFISYSWANQPDVIQIKDRLKADGYRVWFDKEQMGGSTMDAMAEAVENAAVVLICMSEQYKTRPKTRTEAEYTFEQQKPFIPLMMQRHYKPDGWLGLLLGSRFYINFDGKYEFEEAYEMLVRELKGRGKNKPPLIGGIMSTDQAVDVTDSGSAPVIPKPPGISDWEEEKVMNWLAENELSRLQEKLRGLDGKRLARLNRIRVEAPEFFYSYLADKLSMDMVEIATFTEGLASLRA